MVLSGVVQTFLKFDYSTVYFADFVPPCVGLKQITIAGINTKKIWHSFYLGIKKPKVPVSKRKLFVPTVIFG